MENSRHHTVIIIGAGSAGITVAAQLLKKQSDLDVLLVDPCAEHYYQPAWTLVGGGAYSIEKTVRPQRSVIPKGANWLRDSVTEILPKENCIVTERTGKIRYEGLVVCPGIQTNWSAVQGLTDALNTDGVCSNYSFELAPKTWECIQNFKGGTAVFTHPSTPIKCGGAPQKIMYLADDYFRKNGVREKSKIIYATGGAKLFPAEVFETVLKQVILRKSIETHLQTDLIAVRPESREAVFKITKPEKTEEWIVNYDFLHVTPPMSAPAFIQQSELAHTEGPLKGWLQVDVNTLQSPKYKNVFGLGDSAGLPISKTGAAIRKQAPVVVSQLLAYLHGTSSEEKYFGYTSCPLVTGYGKLILAEFDYTHKPTPSFPIDQTKERLSMWLMKKYFLPWMYWNVMLKGKELENFPLPKWPERTVPIPQP